MKHRNKFLLLTALAYTHAASAASIDSDASGEWTTAGTWSNNAVPSSGNDYFVKNGFTVDSPVAGSGTSPGPVLTFGGDAITVENGGVLRLRHTNGGGNAFIQYDLKSLTLQSGATLQSFNTSTGNVIRRLNSPLVVAPSGEVTIRIQSDNAAAWTNHLYLNGSLSGGADISLTGGLAAGSTGDRRVLRISSADNTYSGNWNVTGEGGDDSRRLFLEADAANALGSGTVTLNLRSQLRVTPNGTINSISSVTLNQSTSTLQFQNSGGWSNSAASLIANNGTITLGTGASSIGTFRLDSAGTVTLNADTGGSLAATTFDLRRGTLSGTGNLTGSGALTKTTNGTAIISTTNSGYGGHVTVSDGILRLNNSSAIGSATNIIVENAKNPASFNNTTLELAGGHTYGAGATLTLRNNSTSNINNARANLTNQSGDNTWAGAIVFDGGLNQALSTSAGTLTITGDISQSSSPSPAVFLRGAAGTGIITGNINLGSANLTKTDAGTWEINSNGHTWANTGVSVGTLRLGASNALPATTSLTIGQGDNNSTTLDLNGFSQTVANLAASIGSSGTKQITTATAATLTVNNAANNSYAGVLAGALSLEKTNSGILTLSGISTHSGPTFVSAGTLLVTGALANSNVTVDAAATFGGTGSLGGNLAFDAASIFRIEDINNPLTVTGTVTFGSGFGIANLTNVDWDSLGLNTPYTLISTTQSFSASDIENFGIANAANVGSGRQAYFQSGSLQVVVIPEPSSALLGALGAIMLLRRRR